MVAERAAAVNGEKIHHRDTENTENYREHREV
jgi:hypothetical protein